VGIVEDRPLCDLCYVEDRDASVDANIVMTGQGNFVEAQASGEEATFTHQQLQDLLGLADNGIKQLTEMQQAILATI
jgi:ribonuclease PH